MVTKPLYDAIIIGSGPNGLAAAITIARTGRSVLVFEAKETIGGGCRSAELTLPGFTHDVCSAIHPLGLASAFFRTLPLEQYDVEWIHPEIPPQFFCLLLASYQLVAQRAAYPVGRSSVRIW